MLNITELALIANSKTPILKHILINKINAQFNEDIEYRVINAQIDRLISLNLLQKNTSQEYFRTANGEQTLKEQVRDLNLKLQKIMVYSI